MRKSVADYLPALPVAEYEREADDQPPFSVQRAQVVAEANTLRDLLRANKEPVPVIRFLLAARPW